MNRISFFAFTAVFIPAASFPQTLSYLETNPVPAGSNPRGVAAGDVTGDGLADLVVANFGSGTFIGQEVPQESQNQLGSTVQLFVPSPGGLALAASAQTGASNRGVALANLDGEGGLEAVVSAYDRGTLMVFRYQGGGLHKIQEVPVPEKPVGVAAGALEAGGPLFVAVTSFAENKLSIFPVKEDGHLDVAKRLDVAVAAGSTQVALGDFDGDGIAEFAVACLHANRVDVVGRGKDGAFTVKSSLVLPEGSGPADLEAADVNGDGRTDLAVANFSGSTLAVFLQKESGTLAVQPLLETSGPHPNGLAAGDLDGDGASEIVLAVRDSDQLDVFGFGEAAPRRLFTLEVAAGDEEKKLGPVEAAVLDADGDGDPDLAASHMRSGTVRVFLREGDGGEEPTPTPEGFEGLVSEVRAGPNVSDGKTPITFFFTLNRSAEVTLTIYTLTGEALYTTTVRGNRGANELVWRAENNARRAVASGMYLYTLTVDDGAETQRRRGKILIIR